jgi:outer membrane receptor for ferrienterochelin and colicins
MSQPLSASTAVVARAATAVFLVLALATPVALHAQEAGRALVRVTSEGAPVEGAQVFSGPVGGLTGADGLVELRLPGGPTRIRVERIGFAAEEIDLTVPFGGAVEVDVELEVEAVEEEVIIVTSTRSERRIEDQPIRVEVVAREEVEEKLLMTPGDIAMLLNETAGLRVQSTAPSLGGASVRIQGLRGRYTQILSDGLPLYGGQTGALGPLQIPPMDLGQVEIIKGAASALYGASALGGVVNLISRRPGEAGEHELMLNQSTLGATDGIGWSSGPLNERWGYTLIASGHRQSRADVDEDGWADLPTYRRAVARPRLFWSGEGGASALVTIGGMIEEREGGTMPDSVTPAGSEFREGLDTRRLDAGLVGRRFVGEDRILSLRGSGALQRHDHRFGDRTERDAHATGFVETALSGADGAHTWVLGLALQSDRFDAGSVPGFDYTFTVPGLFAQDEWAPARWLTLSASARLDRHSEYGTSFNPRLSTLLRSENGWTTRASAGTGYFGPTPWTDETEAVGLGQVEPLSGLSAERARSVSVDVGRVIGPLELNLTWFGSAIENAVQARNRPPSSGGAPLELANTEGDVRTTGTELLARFEGGGFHISATHVWMRSTEPDPRGAGRRAVPLTPRHTAGLVAAWEQEGLSRVGIELYYTGTQSLEDNPYRDRSEDYLVFGFLVDRRIGPVRVFLNAENVFDTRQTRYDRLVLPERSVEGLWITDVWAPLEGRAFNGGVRWMVGP